ncbi:MAG: hypothetical protein WDN76_06600 [Alphaproteobacteria bacterium]
MASADAPGVASPRSAGRVSAVTNVFAQACAAGVSAAIVDGASMTT